MNFLPFDPVSFTTLGDAGLFALSGKPTGNLHYLKDVPTSYMTVKRLRYGVLEISRDIRGLSGSSSYTHTGEATISIIPHSTRVVNRFQIPLVSKILSAIHPSAALRDGVGLLAVEAKNLRGCRRIFLW